MLSAVWVQVFLSIKGVYFQAEVQGQNVNWLVPWKFSQQPPRDVDYRVMLTFLDIHRVRAPLRHSPFFLHQASLEALVCLPVVAWLRITYHLVAD